MSGIYTLSLIWDESHKWQNIAAPLGISERDVRTKLKNIVSRRNQIVHESDIDPVTGLKADLSANIVDDVVDFIEKLCHSVASLVI
nr:HEPN domain-containing protein [Chitinophaga sp. GbtcB8]